RSGALAGWPLIWGAVLVLETAALRLIYPVAIVLVERAWTGLAVALATLSIGLSVLRGATIDRLTRVVRKTLFDFVSDSIECYPALAPAGSPPIEQLESEIARGIPWVEALLGVTLPSIFGNLLALPIIAWLCWVRIGAEATVIASAAMLAGVAAGVAVARQVGELGEVAWSNYQPVARLIECGLRGRVELGVHHRSSAYRARLLAQVANWSVVERRAYVWGGIAGWSAPVAAALTAAVLTRLDGVAPLELLRRIITHPSGPAVVAGLLALSALPLLSSLSRGIAQWFAERPHLAALERFVESAPAKRSGAVMPIVPSTPPLGSIHAERVRFTYPRRQPGDSPSAVEADVVWAAHETLAIAGANGCGKTTLTWLLMGIIEPEQGTVRVGMDGASHCPAVLAGRIAYLPQQPYFDELETVREAIRFVAPEATDEAAEDLITRLLQGHFTGDVQTLMERRVMSLSMGERRAVAVARVLLRKSDAIILDEPEANLDADLRQRVMNVLRLAKRHSRMLIVTHDEAFAAVADRVYRMPSTEAPMGGNHSSAAE
ncbi:MAG TPA: ABC transporter ATP-binding protein, partial [Polyangiaceae bacterium]|nr:ABC transporter ATP-binding protein [Polyangiaceae bacterium]